jgi:hypothetical protein
MEMALSIVLAVIGRVLPMERERSRAARQAQVAQVALEEEESPVWQHAAEQRRVVDPDEEQRVLERLWAAASWLPRRWVPLREALARQVQALESKQEEEQQEMQQEERPCLGRLARKRDCLKEQERQREPNLVRLPEARM